MALILLGDGWSQFLIKGRLAGRLVEHAAFCPTAVVPESVTGFCHFLLYQPFYYLLFMASFSANLGFCLVGNPGISSQLICETNYYFSLPFHQLVIESPQQSHKCELRGRELGVTEVGDMVVCVHIIDLYLPARFKSNFKYAIFIV